MEIPTTFLVAIFTAIIAVSITAAFLMVPTVWHKIAGREVELAAAKPVAVAVPYQGKWYLAVFASMPAEITRIYTASGDVIAVYNGSIQLPCSPTSAGGQCRVVLVLPERPSVVELRLGSTTAVIPVAGYARYNPFAPIRHIFNINFTGPPGVYVLAAPSNISTSSSWQLYLLGLPVYASNSGPWPLTTNGGPGRYAVWGMSDWPGLRYSVNCSAVEEYGWAWDPRVGARVFALNKWNICGPVFGASQRLSRHGTYIMLFAESPAKVVVPPWSNYGTTPTRPPFYCNFTLYRAYYVYWRWDGSVRYEPGPYKAYVDCIYNTGLSLNDICWTERDKESGKKKTVCKKPMKLFIDIDVKPHNDTHLIARVSLAGMLVDRYDNFMLWVSDGDARFYPPLLLVRQIEYLPWPKLYDVTVTFSKGYIVNASDHGVFNECLTC